MKDTLAPCGIDCGICQVYVATQNDDSAARNKLAEQFFQMHAKEVDPETIVCDGCSSNERHIGFCSACQIRACAKGNGFATCAECAEFPCEQGQFIWTSKSKSLENLNKLKEKHI